MSLEKNSVLKIRFSAKILIKKKVLPCDLNPAQCKNGATCINDMAGGSSCICANGYTGEKCDTG